jgi:hypothetical protein
MDLGSGRRTLETYEIVVSESFGEVVSKLVVRIRGI